jgi:cytochrome c2
MKWLNPAWKATVQGQSEVSPLPWTLLKVHNTSPANEEHDMTHWRFATFCFTGLILCTNPVAAAPFPNGDPKPGEKLFSEKNCNACHAQKFGGTGEQMFTRAERKVTTPAKLAAQIAVCNTNLKSGWFPEDEENVAAFLNQKYYKFK